jgi:hypothetical protein
MSVISEKENNVCSGKEAAIKQFEDLKLTHSAEVSQLESEVQSLLTEIEILKSSNHEKLVEAEHLAEMEESQAEQEKQALRNQIDEL